jgi:hypothetical protein
MNSTFFHWPDHVIGKHESRRIREHHNACENSRQDLRVALEMFVREYQGNGQDEREARPEMRAARKALAAALGETKP